MVPDALNHSMPASWHSGHLHSFSSARSHQFPCTAPQVAPGGLTIPGLAGSVQRSSRHAAVLPLSAGVRVSRVALAPRTGLLACAGTDKQNKETVAGAPGC